MEVTRGARRVSPAAVVRARAVIEGLSLIAVSAKVLQQAMDLPSPYLRTLDAIYVATAMDVGSELGAVIAYDQRLLEAAADAGLPILSPS